MFKLFLRELPQNALWFLGDFVQGFVLDSLSETLANFFKNFYEIFFQGFHSHFLQRFSLKNTSLRIFFQKFPKVFFLQEFHQNSLSSFVSLFRKSQKIPFEIPSENSQGIISLKHPANLCRDFLKISTRGSIKHFYRYCNKKIFKDSLRNHFRIFFGNFLNDFGWNSLKCSARNSLNSSSSSS